MKCFKEDVAKLGLHFCDAWSPPKAKQILGQLAEDVKYYDQYLDHFPDVKVERLDKLYALASGLGAFDSTFLSIQLNEFGWRGIIAGGIYSLLRPDETHLKNLVSISPPDHPENTWACRCAVANLDNEPWPEDCIELEDFFVTLRDATNRLGITKTHIRRQPDTSDALDMKQFREFTRAVYQEHGLEQAKEAIRNRPEYEWTISHNQWVEEFAVRTDCRSLYQPK